MRKPALLILVIIPILYSSCFTDEDDLISQKCTSGCTFVTGKIQQPGNIPLANIPVTLYWKNNSGFLSGVVRKKAVVNANTLGEYQLKYTMREDEKLSGYFLIELTLDGKKYLVPNSNQFSFGLTKPDTTVQLNFLIPRKATLKVTPSGTELMKQTDYFSIYASHPYGINNGCCLGTLQTFSPTSNKTTSVFVGANLPVIIEVYQLKDNVITQKFDTLTLTPDQVLPYQVRFN